MKKIMKSLVAITLTLGLLVACGGSSDSAATVKMGVASTQQVFETSSEDDDSVEFNTVVAGVALKDDKVAYISIDESQQFVEGTEDGAQGEVAPTKKEKGLDYGMLETSEEVGIGKEWMDQIAGVEEALIGKTLSEVEEYFAGEEILTAATIILDDIEATVIKAINNAVEVKNVAKVGLGYDAAINIKGDDNEQPESVLEYAMVAVDADGNIIQALIDNAQEKATYENGEWDPKNIGQTKGELKEDYGMLETSENVGIGKEWNDQNDAFMEHVEGLSFEEVSGLSIEDEDLKTSVTIHIDGPQAALAHAEKNLVEIK